MGHMVELSDSNQTLLELSFPRAAAAPRDFVGPWLAHPLSQVTENEGPDSDGEAQALPHRPAGPLGSLAFASSSVI